MQTRSRVAAIAAVGGIALLAEAPIRSQALSPRTVDYDIDVTLDPSTRTLTGVETIDWRNTGAASAYSLRIHLYWNPFRHSNSPWLRQYRLGGGTGFDDRPESDFGRIDISGLQIVGADGAATDLTGGVRFIFPGDQNANDRTLAAVTMPRAVAPGEGLKLRISWTGKFPYNFDRTGVIGNYFFVSQWFPKLGVFGDSGWTSRQFFANSEF